MTIAITLLLASLLIIGILRTARRSQEEIPAEQEMKSPVKAEGISEPLPEPQAEIIIENPPHQEEKKVRVGTGHAESRISAGVNEFNDEIFSLRRC